MHLIAQELNTFVHEWNTHRIRYTKNAGTVWGIPDELYFVPQIHLVNKYINN